MSATKPTVHEAWAAVMTEVQGVGKSGRNQQQGYSFRGIDAVVNAVGPVLRKHGVLVMPSLASWEYTTVEVGQKRTPMGHARVEVNYTVWGPAGDSMPGSAPGEAMDSGDKATAKAMSVAYRTFLIQALALPTDEPDPDEHSYERATPPPPPTADELILDAQAANSAEALNSCARRAVAAGLSPDDLEAVKSVVKARRAELAEGSNAA